MIRLLVIINMCLFASDLCAEPLPVLLFIPAPIHGTHQNALEVLGYHVTNEENLDVMLDGDELRVIYP